MDEEQFRKLKRKVEEAKAEASRAQGALDQLMSRLKEEFECGDLKQAKRRLLDLEQKMMRAEKEFTEALASYERKWKG